MEKKVRRIGVNSARVADKDTVSKVAESEV